MASGSPVECISAVTLAVTDMRRSVEFYEALRFDLAFGGREAAFTTFRVGPGFLNLQLDPPAARDVRVWGRIIFWVDDVDAVYGRVLELGRTAETEPADAPWGERYFHVHDPDGHELSFARPLAR
jgi:catechol 2,3-dioxygenase-like lactoylglutathione lyase family enzyme